MNSVRHPAPVDPPAQYALKERDSQCPFDQTLPRTCGRRGKRHHYLIGACARRMLTVLNNMVKTSRCVSRIKCKVADSIGGNSMKGR